MYFWSCPVPSRSCYWDCVLRHFCGTKRTCWTTGIWWCCLSMKIPSSIPGWFNICYRVLCGIHAFPSDRASTLNQHRCNYKSPVPCAAVKTSYPTTLLFGYCGYHQLPKTDNNGVARIIMSAVAFTWKQLHRKCTITYSVFCVQILYVYNHYNVSQGQWNHK